MKLLENSEERITIEISSQHRQSILSLMAQPQNLDLTRLQLSTDRLEQLRPIFEAQNTNNTDIAKLTVDRESFIDLYRFITAAYRADSTKLTVPRADIEFLKIRMDAMFSEAISKTSVTHADEEKIRNTIERHIATLEDLANR